MAENSPGLIDKIRAQLSTLVLLASGVTLLVSGYFTYDYRQYTNCQVQLLESSYQVNTTFAKAMEVLLAQPPRPIEERRQVLQDLLVVLRHQESVQRELGTCR